jgi:hypothetical protein
MHRCALLRGVLDEHLVKLCASHLPRHCTLVMIGLEKVERMRLFAEVIGKLNDVFADKRTLPHLLENTHSLQCPIGIGHERFANMVESLLLKDHDFRPSRDKMLATSCRPGLLHDNHVIFFNLTVIGCRHLFQNSFSKNSERAFYRPQFVQKKSGRK